MKKTQQGFSLIELLIVIVTIGIIAAIGVPNLLASRRAANEGAAIATIRLLHNSQLVYQLTHGVSNFGGLMALNQSRLIDNLIGTTPHQKSGYIFDIPSSGLVTVSATQPAQFIAVANPVVVSGIPQTGTRRFGIVENGRFAADNTTVNLANPLTRTEVDNATRFGPIVPLD